MSGRPDRIVRATDVAATAAAYIAGVVLVLLMLLTTADVAGRYFFNAPISGVFDLTHFAVSIMTYLGLAYCAVRGAHVAIELLYDKLPTVGQRLLDRITNLAGCILFALISWRTAVQAVTVREMGEASQMMELPLFPLYCLVAFGSALFAWVLGLKAFVPAEKSDGDR